MSTTEPVEGRCNRRMRGGRCLLDEGHHGYGRRCSTAVFYCDCCGKYRRGSHAHAQMLNPWDGEVEAQECWFCHQVMGPIWERQQYDLMDEEMSR